MTIPALCGVYSLLPHLRLHACSDVWVVVKDCSDDGKQDLAVECFTEACVGGKLSQF